MKFRNYCLVIIGDTQGVLLEIKKISESEPNLLDGKGLVIATFSSAASPVELNNYFTLNKRNFLIFDLNPENSGYNINKKEIHEGLFGFLRTMDLDDKSAKLLREIELTSNTKSNKISFTPMKKVSTPKIVLSEKEIDKMSKDDREILWNKIMDNGVENLTENDKEILLYLSKK